MNDGKYTEGVKVVFKEVYQTPDDEPVNVWNMMAKHKATNQ